MSYIKPKHLKKGDVIGICAPASPPDSFEKLEKGILYLEQCGFRIEPGKNIHRKHGYLAGTDQERADDINNLFANKHVKAIFTVRGGYGSHRILPLIDYHKIKQNPKIFIGYSDITAIQLAILSKARLITFSGPMVAVELAEKMNEDYEEYFWEMLANPQYRIVMKSGYNKTKNNTNSEGRLIAGNLSLITGLIGTPYFPEIKQPIYMFEEIDERPYKVDRMFQKLKLAGYIHNAKGFIIGDFSKCAPKSNKKSLTIKEIFKDLFKEFHRPVVHGIHYGHVHNSVFFPIGVKIKINCKTNTIKFLESGVQ